MWAHSLVLLSSLSSIDDSPTPTSPSPFHSFLDDFRHHLLHNNQLSLIIAFSLLSLAYGLYTLLQSSSYSIQVHSLHLFPIKGCAPIHVTHARYDRLGFVHDRRYMLVPRHPTTFDQFIVHDEAAVDREKLSLTPGMPTFHSQRTKPRMALLTPRIDEGRGVMVLSIPAQPDLLIPLLPPPSSPTLAVKVWNDVVLTSVYESPAITEALSSFIGEPTVLVTVLRGDSSIHHRPLNPSFDPTSPSLSIHSSFGDGFPFLLTSVPSLKALNLLVRTRVTPMMAFRPNIVVDGPSHLLPPWDEDYWKELLIEREPFVASKPCQRCAVPTIHPETGERDPLYEPIQTMREQRAKTVGEQGQADGKVYFGMNLVQMKTEGVVRVGDLVRVMSRKQRFMETVSDKKRD